MMETTTETAETKTGAIICVKGLGENDKQYLALLFITEIPGTVTDAELEGLLGGHLNLISDDCEAVIVRADINATSNEVAEQYNFHEDHTQRVPFETFV